MIFMHNNYNQCNVFLNALFSELSFDGFACTFFINAPAAENPLTVTYCLTIISLRSSDSSPQSMVSCFISSLPCYILK